jgi:hypothetical protein
MFPHKLTVLASLSLILTLSNQSLGAQKQKVPPGGKLAIVVDERLSALRTKPALTAKLIRRLGRGRLLAVRVSRKSIDGIVFFLVNVSSRTQGWIQREAVVVPSRAGEDARLLYLVRASIGFDRIARARILLDHFPKSSFCPEVLLILGDAAEQLSAKLSREADSRSSDQSSVPALSFFLNYAGLDRYNRQAVGFIFDEQSRRLHYDGAAWREIVRRYPQSPEAEKARIRLAQLSQVPQSNR